MENIDSLITPEDLELSPSERIDEAISWILAVLCILTVAYVTAYLSFQAWVVLYA